jgi:AcrR family transcriptional regulator
MASGAQPTEGPCGPSLRTDAERNRQLVLAAAHEVFGEQGLGAPMNEVARRAGVGIATLYRRFPTRDDLITETFASKMKAYADAIDEASQDTDPWRGFCRYIERVCAMQASDHGFTHVLTMTFPTAKAFEADRNRAYDAFVELIARAKRTGPKSTGRLRDDFCSQDLVLLLMANAGVVSATGDSSPDAWRRLVAYLLQAFSAEHAQPLPPAPTPKAMYRAMVRLSPHNGNG